MFKVYALTFWIAELLVGWLSYSYNQPTSWLVVWVVNLVG